MSCYTDKELFKINVLILSRCDEFKGQLWDVCDKKLTENVAFLTKIE